MLVRTLEFECSDEFHSWNQLHKVISTTDDLEIAVRAAAAYYIQKNIYNPKEIIAFTVHEELYVGQGCWTITCQSKDDLWDLDVSVVVKEWNI